MNKASRKVQRTYLTLLLLNTLAASLIWGINTLYLLDAGLSNTEAFAANAFFTLGFMIFEIPTGVVARSARTQSVLLAWCHYPGDLNLALFAHVVPVCSFLGLGAVVNALGLGFTFFWEQSKPGWLTHWPTPALRNS